jgi:hypothetical protein
VQPKPAAINRELEAGAILGRAAFVIEQERAVDKLNKDASVLHGLDGIGDLKKLARGGIGSAKGRDATNLFTRAHPSCHFISPLGTSTSWQNSWS